MTSKLILDTPYQKVIQADSNASVMNRKVKVHELYTMVEGALRPTVERISQAMQNQDVRLYAIASLMIEKSLLLQGEIEAREDLIREQFKTIMERANNPEQAAEDAPPTEETTDPVTESTTPPETAPVPLTPKQEQEAIRRRVEQLGGPVVDITTSDDVAIRRIVEA